MVDKSLAEKSVDSEERASGDDCADAQKSRSKMKIKIRKRIKSKRKSKRKTE
jgi:hypothetical protein